VVNILTTMLTVTTFYVYPYSVFTFLVCTLEQTGYWFPMQH